MKLSPINNFLPTIHSKKTSFYRKKILEFTINTQHVVSYCFKPRQCMYVSEMYTKYTTASIKYWVSQKSGNKDF